MKKKVLLGMSGGIDSSVVAFLLKEQGYEIIGAYMNYWNDTSHIAEHNLQKYPENKCCSTESLFSARQIANQLDFPLYTINYKDSFKASVVDSFLEAHTKGLTPNPCVTCNMTIKFGAFFKKMKELGCDYLCTGHYAKTSQIKNTKQYILSVGEDMKKDQSYFLYHLNQEQLSHILFPLGNLTKEETRAIAKKHKLEELLHKKESQGVCFYPEQSYTPFLQRKIPEIFKTGDVVYHEKTIGKHKGLPYYTIGQRRGIDVGGFAEPIYVIGFDYSKNTLIMGDDSELYHNTLSAKNFMYTGDNTDWTSKTIFARIRHLGLLYECEVEIQKNDNVFVQFKNPVRAASPGQNIVFYSEEKQVLGGAEII